MMSVGLGTAIGYLKLDVSGFASGVDSAISDMNKLQNKANTVSGAFTTVGSAMTKVGGLLTAGVTAPLVGAAAASVKFGTEFDAQMSNVKAVSGATATEFDSMRNAAISWGEKTVYTATEAGEALYYMSLAGWDTQKSIDGLGPVLNLAAAGNLNLGRTSDIVTDAMTAMKISAGELNKDGIENTIHFTNALAAAMSNSNTDVDQMGEAFKYVAPLAGSLGMEVNDLSLALGLMANVGVKGSQAGTGLRQALNGLINPTEKAAIVMDQYGISLFNADGSTKNFRQVMLELRSTFGDVGVNASTLGEFIDGLGYDLDTAEGEAVAADAIMQQFGHDLPVNDFEKLNAIIKIFGIRALPGVLGIIEQSDDAFNDLAAAIDNSDAAFVKYEGQIYTMEEALAKFGDAVYKDKSFEILGAAAGMAEVQMDNLQGDWTKFTSALGTSQILISDMVKGVLRDLVQKLTEIVTWFNNLSDEQRDQIAKWALIAASVGPVLLAIGKLITGVVNLYNNFKTLKTAFSVIGTAVKGLGSTITTALGSISAPVIAVVAIIAVLVAAFVNLWKNNEEFRNKIIEIWNNIKAKFEEAGQRIVEIFNELGFNFEDFKELMGAAIEWLKGVWDGFCELLAPVFVGVFDYLKVVLSGWIDFFVGLFEVIAGIIKGFKDGDWSMFWQGMADIVQAVIDTIVGVLDVLGETIWNVVQTVANWLGADWNMSWDEAKQAVADWFNSVVQWVSDLVGKIGQFFSNIWQTITTVCNNIWNTIVSIWNAIVTTITNVLQTIVTGVQNAWNNVTTAISNFMQLIWNTITTVWNTISDAVTTVMDIIWTTIQSVWNTIWTTIQSVMESIWECISTVWETIRSTVETVVTTIWNTIKDVFYNIALSITEIILGIKEIITNVWNAIKSFLQGNVDEAKNHIINAWEMVKTLLSALMDNIRNMFNTVWNAIKTIITTVTNAIHTVISTVWNTIKTVLSTIMTAIQNTMTTVWTAIKNTITTITNAIHTVISTVWNTIKTVLSTILTAIQNTMNTVWNAIKTLITTIVNAISTFLSNTWNNIKTTISTIVNAIKQTISDVFNAIKTTITNITNAIQTLLTNVWNNIKTTITNVVNNIKTTIVNTFNNIKSSVTNTINALYTSISNVFNNIKTAMSNAINTAKSNVISAMQNAYNGMVNVFSNVGSTFANIGKNVIQGIINGIGSMVSSLYDSIKNALSGLVDKAKSALGINSPSRVFKEQIGKWLPPGIAEGFVKAMPAAIEDIEDSLNDGIDSIETNDIDAGNTNLEVQIADFVNAYQNVFEGLVIWFETMEERMAVAVESLAEYFKYLMYVRQVLGSDEEFRNFVLGDDDNKPKKPTSPDTPVTPIGDGGDTFIFQSPKPINEVQAARLLRNTKRDLAEGF